MRLRAVHVVSVATLLTVAAVPPAAADVIEGTDGRDRLSGTAQRDTIRGYGGRGPARINALFNDKVWAGGGNDVIRVVESPAPPWLNMMVDCGPGEDTVIWLEGEAFESEGCERVLTP